MIVAGFDLETEWLDPVDPTKARIWETAVVLWDTNDNVPLMFESDLIWQDDYIYDPRMKIQKDHLETYATWPLNALDRVRKAFELCDAIVAHNGKDFDKVVIEAEFKRNGMGKVPKKLWIDTMFDVPFPDHIDTRKLEFLGTAHGFLNPFAHRAIFDVCAMLRVCSAYSWDEIIGRARTPEMYIVGDVTPPWNDQGKSVAEAKTLGYRFDPETKNWFKKIKENELDEQRRLASFRVGTWNTKTKELNK